MPKWQHYSTKYKYIKTNDSINVVSLVAIFGVTQMIIADLHYHKIVEDNSVVGGNSGINSYLKVNYQQISVTQLGLASAQSVSFFGNANSLATAVNIPNITQVI